MHPLKIISQSPNSFKRIRHIFSKRQVIYPILIVGILKSDLSVHKKALSISGERFSYLKQLPYCCITGLNL